MNQTLLEQLEEVVMYNRTQVEKVEGDQGSAENIVEFEFEGMAIYDPYMDESSRFEVNPIMYYGEANIQYMVETFQQRKK